jgi:hypothetical protein
VIPGRPMNEEALLQDFHASQRRKARIGAVVVALGIAGFLALRFYQSYQRAEITTRMEALQHGRIVEPRFTPSAAGTASAARRTVGASSP